jgi:hypothetical protein
MAVCNDCTEYKDGALSKNYDGWCLKHKVEVTKGTYCKSKKEVKNG